MRTAAIGLAMLLALVACSPPDDPEYLDGDDDDAGDDDSGPDPADELYDPDHIVEVTIEMLPADWLAMVGEQNEMLALLEGADCLDAPIGNPYHWYEADVVIDGVELTQVGIRKKGLIGSLSEEKPGLKLKFDRFVDDQTYNGIERLTLNNAVSDRSLVRQCIGYQLFADAGIAASRCNFATVSANGTNLGVYVNVEPVKKDFLRHNYPDEDGHLYEGTLSDFRDEWLGTFEPKTDMTDPEKGPILDVATALEADDAGLVAALEGPLDLDSYITFWAMEVLVGHVDGYAGNTNNFLVYTDLTTDQMTFIPWGIDAILRDFEAFGMESSSAVLAAGALPHRLYEVDETRAMYLDRLLELLDTVWDEDAILAEIDRMEQLVAPVTLPDPWMEAELEQVRQFVIDRRAEVEAQVAAGPTWDEPLRESPCLVEIGELSAEFDTTWDTLGTKDVLATGWGQADITWDGSTIPTVTGGAIAGADGDRAIFAVVAMNGETDAIEVAVSTDMNSVQPGEWPLDLGWRVGYYFTLDLQTQEEFQFQAYLVDGTLTFVEASPVPGAPFSGTVDGRLFVGGL